MRHSVIASPSDELGFEVLTRFALSGAAHRAVVFETKNSSRPFLFFIPILFLSHCMKVPPQRSSASTTKPLLVGGILGEGVFQDAGYPRKKKNASVRPMTGRLFFHCSIDLSPVGPVQLHCSILNILGLLEGTLCL